MICGYNKTTDPETNQHSAPASARRWSEETFRMIFYNNNNSEEEELDETQKLKKWRKFLFRAELVWELEY